MIHLGDITKIKGNEAPVVDVIIGGSPCQDLSVAGKRAGLAGERSGLYMDQIRIIKEMRDKDELGGRTGQFIRPRYMVWENVPGAFSSNGGKDFAAVLEEAIKVAEPKAPDVPVPEKGWPTSGCLMGDGWSVAWRVLDAQFWGVPQRRRRIALVADFGGQSAPEILFVRKGVSGNPDESQQERKATARDAENRPGTDDRGGIAYTLKIRGGCSGGGKGALIQTDRSATLSTLQDQTLFQPILDDQGGSQISVRHDGKCPTLRAETHGNLPCVMEPVGYEMQAFGHYKDSGIASSLKSRDYKDATDLVTSPVMCLASCSANAEMTDGDISPTLLSRAGTGGNNVPSVVMNEQVEGFAAGGFGNYTEGVGTLRASGGDYGGGTETLIRCKHIVRRLTPLECERLQGFPDNWTDIGGWVDSNGKKHKEADSPRYKALGNSIAIPPWKWVLKRLCACYERDATMASLFDGIGGFPYIWEQINGKGSCLWASEIEEFPMAVTRIRFGEGQ